MSSLQSVVLRSPFLLTGGFPADEGDTLASSVLAKKGSGEPDSGSRSKRMESIKGDAKTVQQAMLSDKETDSSKELLECIGLVATQRDRAAFLKIFKYFSPRVKGFLVGRGLNQQTADDVLQEVMLAVWQKAHNFSSAKAGLSTWIFTIARYKYIDRLRHDGRRKTEADEPDLRASNAPLSDDELFEDQRKVAVQGAIARLPEDQQSVIFLSFIKGLSHSEIAEQLGLPLGTVKSRIRRAFGQLREELGEVM